MFEVTTNKTCAARQAKTKKKKRKLRKQLRALGC